MQKGRFKNVVLVGLETLELRIGNSHVQRILW